MVSLIDSVWWRADINFAERRPFARIAMSGSLSFCGALERFAGRATLLPLDEGAAASSAAPPPLGQSEKVH